MTLCDYNLVKRRGGGRHLPVAPMGSIKHPQRHVIQNDVNWASLAIFYQSGPRLTQFLIGPDRFQISLAQPRFSCPAGAKIAFALSHGPGVSLAYAQSTSPFFCVFC